MENNNSNNYVKTSAKAGIGFGAALAMVISYVNWNSIILAAIHGILGWIYVIYFIIKHGWS